MKLELEIYGALCSTSKFNINDIEADYYDFGSKGDSEPESAEEYGCGNMQFTPSTATKDILAKYKINENEYNEICEQLREKLSFGNCGWCV